MEETGEASGLIGSLASLEESGLGHSLRSSPWLFPTVESLHIIGFALLVGAIVSFDVKLLRQGPEPGTQNALAIWPLPLAQLGFLLAAPTGALLFVSEATSYAANPAFLAKLGLVALALLNVVWFHLRAHRSLTAGRASAAFSAISWLAVIVLGRLIAYL